MGRISVHGLLAALLLAGAARAEGLLVTVDGEPVDVTPALELLAGRAPRPGDVVQVGGARLAVVAGDTRLELVTDGERLAERRDGRSWPLQASVSGLAGLDARERRALREVTVDRWEATTADLLSGLDLARCVLVLVDGGLVETPIEGVDPGAGQRRAAPPLPADTRHLVISICATAGEDVFDLSALGGLRALETLEVERSDVGLPPLAKLVGLRTLRVPGRGRTDLTPLVGLPALEALDLLGWPVEDLAPLARLRTLERLDLRCTRVRTLAPLAGLPRLAVVRAASSRVEALPPTGFAALRELDLMSTDVPAAQAAAFRKGHPGCKLLVSWMDRLREATAGVDRVRLRTGGACHTDPARERTLRELTGADAAELLRRLTILEEPPADWLAGRVEEFLEAHDRDRDGAVAFDELSRWERDELDVREGGRLDRPAIERAMRRDFLDVSCKCCGSASFELYRGPTLVATIAFHHGQAVSWDGWPADGLLSAEVGRWLTALVKAAGGDVR